jgi:enediyne biosynthesis protein E4
MEPKVFSFNGKTFDELQNTGLGNLHGWWQTVAASDLNGDGKEDLVLGNVGENFYLKPDAANPVKLWISDFDQNGTPEQFLTRSIGGKDMPVFLKREITDQFPGLKKQNLRHSDYAAKTIQDLFGPEAVKKSGTKLFNYCRSITAINNGKGGFSVQPLPVMVQLSSVKAISTTDVNADGKPDLVLGGNLFGFQPQFGRLDGSYGHVLINSGGGNFKWVDATQSGLSLRGEIKDIRVVPVKGKRCVLVLQNNELPVMYQLNK